MNGAARLFVHGNINGFGFHHADDLFGIVMALGFDDESDRDRSRADFDCARIETHEVSHKHGRDEFDAAHGYGHKKFVGLFAGFDAARLIEMSKNDAAKNRTTRIGIARQHRNTNRQFTGSFSYRVHK
jgi:hypothetical protein